MFARVIKNGWSLAFCLVMVGAFVMAAFAVFEVGGAESCNFWLSFAIVMPLWYAMEWLDYRSEHKMEATTWFERRVTGRERVLAAVSMLLMIAPMFLFTPVDEPVPNTQETQYRLRMIGDATFICPV